MTKALLFLSVIGLLITSCEKDSDDQNAADLTLVDSAEIETTMIDTAKVDEIILNKVLVGNDSFDVNHAYYCDEFDTNGDSLNYISILSVDWNTFQSLGNEADFIAVQFILDSELNDSIYSSDLIIGYDVDYVVNGQQFEISAEADNLDSTCNVVITSVNDTTYQIDYLFKSQGVDNISGSYLGNINNICN